MRVLVGALLGGAVIATVATAQGIGPAPLVVGAASAGLQTGTPVTLRTTAELSTRSDALRVGQRVPLEVAEAVTLAGRTVIPAGSPAAGEITAVRKKGMWGKSGAIAARVLWVRVGDRQIRASGTFDDKGRTGSAGVAAAIAFVPVAGFFTTGTSAVVPAGATVTAVLDEDVPVQSAAAASAVLPTRR